MYERFCGACHKQLESGYNCYMRPRMMVLDLAKYELNGRSEYSIRFFCDDECKEKYLQRHLICEYKGTPIYYFSGVFVLYPDAYYGFYDISECKKHIDMRKEKPIAVMPRKSLLSLHLKGYC